MILDVSHLVVSSHQFEENQALLHQLGYQTIFNESNVENGDVKRPLFTHFSKRHDVTYHISEHSVSVELLNWGRESRCSSNFVPLFDAVDTRFFQKEGQLLVGNMSLTTGVLVTCSFPVFLLSANSLGDHCPGSMATRLNKVVVKTSDIQTSLRFWKHFSFTVLMKNGEMAILQFRSILPTAKPFYLYILRSTEVNLQPKLDDNGLSCISFLSSSAEKEKQRLEKAGLELFDVGALPINNKLLHIFFARGSGGELIEVIDVTDAPYKGRGGGAS